MTHHEVVKKLIDSKAVDFNAIGKVVAEIGPSLAMADEPWERFCGTNRIFIRIFNLGLNGTQVQTNSLQKLGQAGEVLGG